jgi:Mg-chelatase subunit ChlD
MFSPKYQQPPNGNRMTKSNVEMPINRDKDENNLQSKSYTDKMKRNHVTPTTNLVPESATFAITLQLQDHACQKDNSQDVLCMIVDVSGSMNSALVLKDLTGHAIEGANLTKLEMVRHAVKVAITSLPLGTHVGVVAYGDSVSELVPFTQIAEESDRARIIQEVSKMRTNGCTDIFKALEFSAQATLRYCEKTNCIRSHARKKMWLLTDGLPYSPNMPVKKGEEIIEGFELLAYTNRRVKELQISTFGFGSGQEIETDVLEKLARMTGGSFGYIPDPSMLACNINGRNANDFMSISNETIEVSFPNDFIMECVGGTVVTQSTRGDSRVVSVKLRGAFKKGIPRHVYFTLYKQPESALSHANPTTLRAPAKPSLVCVTDDQRLTTNVEQIASLESLKLLLEEDGAGHVDLVLPLLFSFVSALSKTSEGMIGRVIDFVNGIRSMPGTDNREDYEFLLGILHDAKEAKNACCSQYLDAWGKHYLRALLSAYECEESLSSRDLGTISLFVNKSNEMKNVVADMNEKFKSFAIQSSFPIAQSTVARYADARSTMCFTPMTPIKMADGSFLPIGSLCAGMEVMTQPIQMADLLCPKSSAKIVTVVETKLNGFQEVVHICKSAFATPYHPVKTIVGNGPLGWVFPKDLQHQPGVVPPSFTSVFNLVLDKDHVIFVGDGNVQTVTLGHGYEYGVLKHKFFGTTECLDHLCKLALGKKKSATPPPYVCIQQGSLIREITLDDFDGRIVGIAPEAHTVALL